MEPPLVSPLGRARLTRDYTADEDPSSPLANEGAMSTNDYGLTSPTKRPPEVGSDSTMSYDGGVRNSRNQRAKSLQNQESSNIRSWSFQSSPTRQTTAEQLDLEELGKLVFDLETIDERKSAEPPSSAFSRASQSTAPTSVSAYKVLDFFSDDVFQVVMHNPATFHQLLRFSRSRLCGENLEFLDKVDKYNALLNELADSMFEIHREYISVNAVNQINIPAGVLIQVNKDMKAVLTSSMPKLETVFVDAQNDIQRLVAMDIYPRFIRHQMTISTTRALAGDRGKYAGLGDCFVLTDPTKADNPIVYASDGFVKVTGYPRNEIIPRNCRFLQCRHTEKSAVGRMHEAIDSRQESVELLLNQKKSGEPFWNLLYTTPLFDVNGDLVFFLGGQVNCSTTIHNASDVLKILSMAGDGEDETADSHLVSPGPKKSPSLTDKLRSSFWPKPHVQPHRQAGMEEAVLKRMEKTNLKKQMDTFYTSYSKFLVINYSTFYITFHSGGIKSLLYPSKSTLTLNTMTSPEIPIVGMDVFRFLSAHSPTKLSGDFKTRVRTALRMGAAISLDVTLCTRRYMGYEKFAIHWTPMKNEAGEVSFVVCTLGSFQD